jgi:hypothetical protein
MDMRTRGAWTQSEGQGQPLFVIDRTPTPIDLTDETDAEKSVLRRRDDSSSQLCDSGTATPVFDQRSGDLAGCDSGMATPVIDLSYPSGASTPVLSSRMVSGENTLSCASTPLLSSRMVSGENTPEPSQKKKVRMIISSRLTRGSTSLWR